MRSFFNRLSTTAILLLVCALLLALWVAFALRRVHSAEASGLSRTRPSTPVRRQFEGDLDSLASDLVVLDSSLRAHSASASPVAFRRARRAYKRVEGLLAYYSPTALAVIDGPVQEEGVDDTPTALGRQAAFERIETIVFASEIQPNDWQEAIAASDAIRSALRSFRLATKLLDVSDSATLDAARLELARVTTLGLAGFDSDRSGDGIVESADAIDGVRRSVAQLVVASRAPSAWQLADRSLDAAVRNLSVQPSFEVFDRLEFIGQYARDASVAIQTLRSAVDAAPSASRRAWRASAATPFDSAAFDAWAFAPDNSVAADTVLVARGKQLFFDAKLSGPGTRSCASCHVPSAGFSDGRAHAATLDAHDAHVLRRTPTLWNVALQPALFADQRAASLEDQIRFVLSSHTEMSSPPAVVGDRSIRAALAAYLRTLTSLDSRFDRAVRGDRSALTDSERHGFNVFMGKARCATCHFAPLFNGTMPPDFTRSELEIIGVPAARATSRASTDADPGRAGVDGLPVHEHAFKVPSLRNVALTAPYMHNGVFTTLDQVVDFYDGGGGLGIGERLPQQTLPGEPLHLSASERSDVVAFLRALTDTSALATRSMNAAVARP